MDMNYYKQYEPIFGSWTITRQIGEGSFGKVFEIQREDFGTTYKAALKAITVPASEAELLEAKADGMDEASIRTYFGSFVEELVKEFALMSRLKGNSNVVSYEDHQVIEHKDDIGWDILIRMELLTPLNRYISSHTVTVQDVIKLGIDLCRALELCQKFNIIHRDIKPENIFISDTGDFKLGDFGIARTVEKTTSGLSKKGTYTYMAPEVYKGEPYNSTVDIYSLGIVLYRLLNGNRTPFLPAAPAPITHADRENALGRRFSGAVLPKPSHAEGRLAEIVLKACSFNPKERYSSPMQMRQELEAILYNREERQYIYPEGDDVPQDSVHYVKTGEEAPVAEADATQKDGGSVPDAGQTTAEDSDGTVSNFGGTVSDFGGMVKEPGSREATVSDFGSAVKPTPVLNGQARVPWLTSQCIPLALAVLAANVISNLCVQTVMLHFNFDAYTFDEMLLRILLWDSILAGLLLYTFLNHSWRTFLLTIPAMAVGILISYLFGCGRAMNIQYTFASLLYSMVWEIAPCVVCVLISEFAAKRNWPQRKKRVSAAAGYLIVYCMENAHSIGLQRSLHGSLDEKLPGLLAFLLPPLALLFTCFLVKMLVKRGNGKSRYWHLFAVYAVLAVAVYIVQRLSYGQLLH